MSNFDNDANASEAAATAAAAAAAAVAANFWTGSDRQHDPPNKKIILDKEQASVVQGSFSSMTAAAQSEGGHQAFKYDHERRRQQAKRFLNHNSETNSSCVKFGWCDNPHCKRMVDGIDDNNSDVEESTTFSSGGSEEEFPEPDPSDPADGGLPCMARWRENPGREAMDLG